MADYTPQQVREALTRTFSASELEMFISDYFSDALKDIPANASLNEQAQKLVTHCQRRDRFDELIDKIEQERPHAFDPITPTRDTLPRRAQFFGRKVEIEQVLRALGTDDRSWGIVLDGIGGIGKTALAVECAHIALERGLFRVAVFVSAKTNVLTSGEIKSLNPSAKTVDEFVNETSRAIGREGIAKESSEAKHRALLAALRGQRALLIYDNLETINKEEHEAMADWLRDLPTGCKALLTSRRQGGAGAVWLRLDKLEDDAARELIRAEMQKDAALAAKFNRAPLDKWQMLIDETGGSPLALTNVLGLLRQRASLSVDGAIDWLRSKDATEDLMRFVFQEARKELTDNDAIALRALSFFVRSASFEAWAEVAKLSRKALENTIDRLNTLSLLVNGEGEERYALHPLVREFTHGELLSDAAIRQVMEQNFIEYWLAFAERYGGRGKDSHGNYGILLAEWSNISAATDLLWIVARSHYTDSAEVVEKSQISNSSDLMIRMEQAFSNALWFAGLWDDRIKYAGYRYELSLAAQKWSDAGWGARDIAWVHLSCGEKESAQHWADLAYSAWKRGGTKHELAIGERLLGLVAKQFGDYESAQRHLDKALAIHQSLRRSEDQGVVFNSLGELAQTRGNYEEAEFFYHRALDVATKSGNEESLADRLGNLGSLELARSNYGQARHWLEQALPLAVKVRRQDLVGSHKFWLAQVCEADRKSDEALALAQEAVVIYERLRHRNLAEARAFLARLQGGEEA